MVERNEIITLQICSPLQVGAIDRSMKEKKKSNLIKELCYRGEEKYGEKREERQLEREREREREIYGKRID